MPRGRMITGCLGALTAGFSLLPFATTATMAQSEQVLYSFPSDSEPLARPYQDPTGRLDVPAYTGDGYGTLVQATENHGKWKGRTVFKFGGDKGIYPLAGLIADPNGVLYGTTKYGGASGDGIVYSLALVNGAWAENVLYNFGGGVDGGEPDIVLVRDKSTGTLYGTTPVGGSSGCGTIFSLVPSGNNWTFNVPYSFAAVNDGCTPTTGLHTGPKSGAYFGITSFGGANNAGTVYELTEKNGAWSESVIYTFTGGNDGNSPQDLDIDQDTGDLFGVTSAGGAHGKGVVFELTGTRHAWTQSVLYNFAGGKNGEEPVGLHEERTTETLYGTTELGGNYDSGTLFEVVKSGSRGKESVLHSFGASGGGVYPLSRPYEDPATNNLYGTTGFGGKKDGGTIYQVIPQK